MKKHEIRILRPKQQLLKSILSDVTTATVLVFMVYVSKGSTWWTLVTGIMFLSFMFAKIRIAFNQMDNTFKTTDEVRTWLDEIDAEEVGK